MDCSLPGPSIHGIFKARVLEWVAISFSRSSRPRDWTWVSRIIGRRFTVWATKEVHLDRGKEKKNELCPLALISREYHMWEGRHWSLGSGVCWGDTKSSKRPSSHVTDSGLNCGVSELLHQIGSPPGLMNIWKHDMKVKWTKASTPGRDLALEVLGWGETYVSKQSWPAKNIFHFCSCPSGHCPRRQLSTAWSREPITSPSTSTS